MMQGSSLESTASMVNLLAPLHSAMPPVPVPSSLVTRRYDAMLVVPTLLQVETIHSLGSVRDPVAT